MNRKILFLVFITVLFSMQAFARDGRVDYVAADGRFVIFGDYTKHFDVDEKVQLKRDGQTIGVGVVTGVYPTYMMMVPLSTETGAGAKVGDLVERIGRKSEPRIIEEEVTDSRGMEKRVVEEIARIERVGGDGTIVSYGDLMERGFKKGVLAEIVRDGRVIGAAEVLEVGSHLARLKIVGTIGAGVREGDLLRVPPGIAEQAAPEESEETVVKKKKKILTNEEEKEKIEDKKEKSEEGEEKGSLQEKFEKRAGEEREKEDKKIKEKSADTIEKRLENLKKK
ncbi:MAG: hypothetical protein ABIH66_14380 [bacterium]